LMTADSVTEVLVGMAPDILTVIRFGIEFGVLRWFDRELFC
jgi:hypothetical protein